MRKIIKKFKTLSFYHISIVAFTFASMNILILGSGGREHTLAWKIAQSKHCTKLYIAPGNPGTATLGTNLPVAVTDFESIQKTIEDYSIGMLVVGPEDPLVLGIHDFLNPLFPDLHIIGPSQYAAQLEGSKAFAKEFMQKNRIPTAAYKEFTLENYDTGVTYIQNQTLPIVLKADGLAAGKGVVIASTHKEALESFDAMIKQQKFGNAGNKVVIEEFLDGIECSYFAITDGENYCLLPSAKDYKRIGQGDTGLNTGGMGAISPVPFVDAAFHEKVVEQIVKPTIQGLKNDNMDYKGFVFFGLIKVNNEPYVIEYNCRMGDPETEVVLPRLKNDLVAIFLQLKNKNLTTQQLDFSEQAAATVMVVSGGYPEQYEKGKNIELPSVDENSLVFHAGTMLQNNQLVSNGGRVLSITSLSLKLDDALQQSKIIARQVKFEKAYFREDIGWEFV
ncbi:MAG: phosphoribosylamine--glycine ligase [Chitinophagaceae bacterium]